MSNFSMTELAENAKEASLELATMTTAQKDDALRSMANLIIADQDKIIRANRKDLESAFQNKLSEAMIDRLKLDRQRIEGIAKAIEAIANQDDPVGKINHQYQLENGLQVKKVSIPLGVIGMIYESRPNVTADAAALCIKSGNAIILRGGKEAIHSNIAIGNCLKKALKQCGISSDAIGIVADPDRKHLAELLKLDQLLDLIIPRGGENLIKYVSENSRVPVIQHYKGVCHLFIDKEADLEKSISILLNGKVQRPGVCNAIETLLIHDKFGEERIRAIINSLESESVEIRACEKSIGYCSNGTKSRLASDADYAEEFLDLKIAVKVVNNIQEAINHIHQFTSNHTEVIVTENKARADLFVEKVGSSVIMVNASSRFSDGGQLGLGAEIGISTSKLHAYGPMGASSLTTERFVVTGNGQIRD